MKIPWFSDFPTPISKRIDATTVPDPRVKLQLSGGRARFESDLVAQSFRSLHVVAGEGFGLRAVEKVPAKFGVGRVLV